ncbi:hypothetical protein SAMN05661080_02597, partial [Modestobacter sp. DSM 44400]|uniref:IniB N-terminal domain-containing protein n=1 Tax=Modestobacter sp. DSM 44400 TaxID=1550230 RepID=UPI000894EDA0
MTTLASSLLDFILNLLRDPQAASAFETDPEAALSDAGLDDVCAADVNSLVPVLAESVSVGGAMAMTHAAAAHPAMASAAESSDDGSMDHGMPPVAGGQEGPSSHNGEGEGDDGGDDGGHMGVVEYIKYIQSNFTYTEVDASHSVWAGGDAYQLFGDDTVLATGGSVVAGGDADVSYDNRVDISLDDSLNGSGNATTGDGNAVGQGNEVDNTDNSDNSVDVRDSGNDNSVNDSGNTTTVRDSGNDNSDNSTNISDSGNDNSDNSVRDSGND